jgi:glycosyltransferase involved in cell wall biosynthesis
VKVIYATPNFHQNRGNTVTVKRIAKGVERLGVSSTIMSITDGNIPFSLPQSDLIHGFNAYLFYHFLQKLSLKPNSYIITLTGTDLNHHLKLPDSRQDIMNCLQDSRAIHVFNEEAKHMIITQIPQLSEKIFIIAQGVSTHPEPLMITSIKKEPGTFLFVLPAGIRKVKNILFALDTLHRLRDIQPHIRLWLVGPVLDEAEGRLVLDMVQTHKSWVRYLGEVTHKEMNTIYQQADCVLNTSHSEGQPSSILEAMALSVPVLVSDNHGNTSIVSHLETGLVYRTAEEFLQFALLLMSNKDQRLRLGKLAKDYILKHHSCEHEAEQFYKLYLAISKKQPLIK